MFDHPAAIVATKICSPEALSSNREQIISNDGLAARSGMRRAVFHRKSKQAPPLSPIQFVMSMHLKNAAMKIAEDMTMTEPAMAVGYISASRFSGGSNTPMVSHPGDGATRTTDRFCNRRTNQIKTPAGACPWRRSPHPPGRPYSTTEP